MYACSVMSSSLRFRGLQPTRLLRPWYFPGKNTGVGCHFPFQGIFPTQGSNPCFLHLLHWQGGSLPAMPPRKPMLYNGWLLNSFLCKAKDPHLVAHPSDPLETWDMSILSFSWNTSSLLLTLHPFHFRSADSLDSSTECTACHNWILIVQVVLFRHIILSHLQLTWIPSHQAVTWVIFLRRASLVHPPTLGIDNDLSYSGDLCPGLSAHLLFPELYLVLTADYRALLPLSYI